MQSVVQSAVSDTLGMWAKKQVFFVVYTDMKRTLTHSQWWLLMMLLDCLMRPGDNAVDTAFDTVLSTFAAHAGGIDQIRQFARLHEQQSDAFYSTLWSCLIRKVDSLLPLLLPAPEDDLKIAFALASWMSTELTKQPMMRSSISMLHRG